MIRYVLYPFGGYAVYLLFGMAKTYYSHFNPWAEIFEKNRARVMTSVLWILAFVSGLAYLRYLYSMEFLILYYFAPYLVFTAWSSIVTHSHHNHFDVPWYRGEEWSYMKGALSTIDRVYGIFEPIHHNIGTHMVHHLFMKIPHYNLCDATEYIKPVLGEYYRKSEVSLIDNLKDMYEFCRYVPNTGSRVYFSPLKSK